MRDQHLGKIRTFDGDDMTGKVSAYALMALMTMGSVYSTAPAMALPLPPEGGGGIPAPEPEPAKKEEEPSKTSTISSEKEIQKQAATSVLALSSATTQYTYWDLFAIYIKIMVQFAQQYAKLQQINQSNYASNYAPAVQQNEAFNAIEDNAASVPSATAFTLENLSEKKWNMWLSTSGSKTNISGSDGSSAGVATGFSYLWNDRITLGLAGRYNTSENKSASNVKSENKGWTLNPTARIKLTDDIIFGASVAYGQASTEISKNGVKNADYDSQSYLVSGNLSTNWTYQDWIFNPFASVSYYAQRRDAYTDISNNSYSAKTSSLGQASIGANVSRPFLVSDEIALIPSLGLSGTHIFKKIDPASDTLSARVNGGATLLTTKGLSVALQGYYDGIGRSNYEVFGSSIRGALKF